MVKHISRQINMSVSPTFYKCLLCQYPFNKNLQANSYGNDKSPLISLPISHQLSMSKCGWGNSTNILKSDAKICLASALLEQIKITCYTEYKAFGPFTNSQNSKHGKALKTLLYKKLLLKCWCYWHLPSIS